MTEIVPTVEFEIGGKTYRLVFDFNAQAAFEKVTGVSVFNNKAMQPSARIVRALLWAELLHFDPKVRFDEFGEIVDPPELGLRDVGNLIKGANLREINRKVFEAYGLFFMAEQNTEKPDVAVQNPPSR
jgi:hypothetical protein